MPKEGLGEARETLASVLNASPDEFIFTSGSTESSNLAIEGVAQTLGEKKGEHIITSKIEDFPVLNSARALEKQGFKVTYLNLDDFGFVNLEKLSDLITDNTILVSIHHANLVKEIEVGEGKVKVVIDLPHDYQFALSIGEEIVEKIESLWDVEEVRVNFAW